MKNKSKSVGKFLAQAMIKCKIDSHQLFITPALGRTSSNEDLTFEEKNHKEADTVTTCLASEASLKHLGGVQMQN